MGKLREEKSTMSSKIRLFTVSLGLSLALNGTYQIPNQGTVTLINGSYQSDISVTMGDTYARGDFNL
jgi:hypothetical protein